MPLGPFGDALLRYEAVLDRCFHRDTFLLHQLQESAKQSSGASAKKNGKAAPELIDGDIESPWASYRNIGETAKQSQ
jgi:hypothetical protein